MDPGHVSSPTAEPAQPSRVLRAFLGIVDGGFLVYWLITASGLLPPEWLYAHHDDPVMVAWNWSFLPLDLFVSASGLGALWWARRGDARWPLLALVSLAFTSASGLNAIAFWAVQGDFELGWWLPNLVLFIGPWPFVWATLHKARAPAASAGGADGATGSAR